MAGDRHRPTGIPEFDGRPVFGYHTSTVQEQFRAREATGPAQFFLRYLEPGMRVLDLGCGPGTISQDLARIVAPGEVVGCDLEPGMVERATDLAREAGVENLRFEVGNALGLPFPDDGFDAVFSAAVTEHLSEPVRAVGEMRRVVRPGGLVAITRTDWEAPLMSPDAPAMERFFELLEAGFRRQGGSMNSGRHLRRLAREADLEDVEFFADYTNSTDSDAVRAVVSGYVEWVENMPLFDQLAAEGAVTQDELNRMRAEMLAWAEHPEVYLGVPICRYVGRKAGG